jgi:RND family efflux transporter MFP subunit
MNDGQTHRSRIDSRNDPNLQNEAVREATAVSVAFLLALLPVALAGCTTELADNSTGHDVVPADSPKRARVAHPEPVADERSYPSGLYVEGDVLVTARTSGIVEEVLVDRGSRIQKGDPLAVLERDLDAREVEIAEQDVRLAQAEYEQLQSLHRQKVVSPHEFLRGEIARDQAVSKLEMARAYLERCTVRAPFDGVVVERWVVAGQRVMEEDGIPLFRVVARQPLRARVDVSEELLPEMKPGGHALVEGMNGATSNAARIVFVGPAIEPASSTVPVIVEMRERSPSMRLGSTVRVRFERSGGGKRHVSIPLGALPRGPLGGGAPATVMVVEDGRAAVRQVKVIGTRGGSVVVEGALGPEDQVIVGGDGEIVEGTAIDLREEGR